MKKTIGLIAILFSLATAQAQPSLSAFSPTQQTQLKAYITYAVTAAVKDTAAKIRAEYKAADIATASPLIVRLNNQNNDRIALQGRVDLLEKNSDQLLTQIKNIQDSTRELVLDSTVEFVKGPAQDSIKNMFNLAPIQRVVDAILYKVGEIELWKPTIDSIKIDADKLKPLISLLK